MIPGISLRATYTIKSNNSNMTTNTMIIFTGLNGPKRNICCSKESIKQYRLYDGKVSEIISGALSVNGSEANTDKYNMNVKLGYSTMRPDFNK